MICELMLNLAEDGGSTLLVLRGCVGFTYEKALYMPYTRLDALFYLDGRPRFSANQVTSVRFRIDDHEMHNGMPDKVSIEKSVYGYRVRVTSRGYTLLLAQNEPYPKINANVTLRSLCRNNLQCSAITYEDPTPTVGNIYVREGSNVWEAAVAYCIKASGRYPYIRGANEIRMSVGSENTIDYSGKVITELIENTDSTMILSDVYMQELGDDYPFEAHDSSAKAMGIVRSRYYPLDMQWLFDPQKGLQHKLDYSNRKVRAYGLTYRGYQREGLMDRAAGGGDIDGMRINYIKVVGGEKGIFTTVKAYDDRYGQK